MSIHPERREKLGQGQMITWESVPCAVCEQPFRRRVGRPGRPRVYCGRRCRRLNQQVRDAARREPRKIEQWASRIAEDMLALAGDLVEAEQEQAQLAVRLRLARDLAANAQHFIAAAVHDARTAGHSWKAVGEAAGVSADTARARWAEGKVLQQLQRRELRRPPAPRAVSPTPDAPGVLRARATRREQLASALATLHRRSDVTVQRAAELACCSPSYVSRVLLGERVPSWPFVHMLVTILGGNPAEIRLLWEGAHGLAPSGRLAVGDAADQVLAALRGLHLAAGEPDLRDEAYRAVLRGDVVPAWPVVSAMVIALGGQPADVRSVWENLHYAALASALDDALPSHSTGRLPQQGEAGHVPDMGGDGGNGP
ncbi:helix-turn-helix domain-containing protein [Kitasatospora sp. NPDC001309]|uniref:helix-turn-helix domain-containing protein n=1 Tax=Kitasatospora sp. NPDC001309 TaxID=3364013 RepID=UPI0036C67AF0